MLPAFSTLLARLEHVYRGRSYSEGFKARLLAGFSLLIIVFSPSIRSRWPGCSRPSWAHA